MGNAYVSARSKTRCGEVDCVAGAGGGRRSDLHPSPQGAAQAACIQALAAAGEDIAPRQPRPVNRRGRLHATA